MHCSTLYLVLTLLVTGVVSTGWKPIPPPRGIYLQKQPHSIRTTPFKHGLFDDFRFESLKTSLGDHGEDSPKTEELAYHSPTLKYNLEDVFPTTADDNYFHKESTKAFKPSPPTGFDDSLVLKRPAVSFHNFNSFRNRKPPSKPLFYDPDETSGHKPVEVKYRPPKPTLYDDKHSLYYYKLPSQPSYSDNDVQSFSSYKPEGLGDIGSHGYCSLYKVAFKQDLYFQYIQYKTSIPDLKEFTLCMWNKFHNHSNDHPLFSYAVRHQPKAITLWVRNTDRSNYYTMAINGHTIFRLNYPIRLNRWYHTCQSWNGKTGEWQVWVNAERIGRGFHNLLVGHVIPGGGLAISGQEQRQFGGGFLEGPGAPKGAGGLLGELTMVQLYRIALTAGKAYTDHRHHHSIYASTTPEPPSLPADDPPPAPDHPFLENGQLKRPLKVFELAEALRTKGNTDAVDTPPTYSGLDLVNTAFPNQYYGLDPTVMTTYIQPGNGLGIFPYQDHALYKRNDGNEKKEDDRSKRTGDSGEGNHGVETEKKEKKVKFVSNPPVKVHVEKIKYSNKAPEERSDDIDEEWTGYEETRRKRELNETEPFSDPFVTVDEGMEEPEEGDRNSRMLLIRKKRPQTSNRRMSRPYKRSPMGPMTQLRAPRPNRNKNTAKRKEDAGEEQHDQSKRQILLGDPSMGYGSILPPSLLGNDYSLLQAMPLISIPLQQLQHEVPTEYEQPGLEPSGEEEQPEEQDAEEPAKAQPEPAEGEVRRIMAVCSGCELDPFKKVAVISWRSTPKKIYSGALFLKANPECRRF